MEEEIIARHMNYLKRKLQRMRNREHVIRYTHSGDKPVVHPLHNIYPAVLMKYLSRAEELEEEPRYVKEPKIAESDKLPPGFVTAVGHIKLGNELIPVAVLHRVESLQKTRQGGRSLETTEYLKETSIYYDGEDNSFTILHTTGAGEQFVQTGRLRWIKPTDLGRSLARERMVEIINTSVFPFGLYYSERRREHRGDSFVEEEDITPEHREYLRIRETELFKRFERALRALHRRLRLEDLVTALREVEEESATSISRDLRLVGFMKIQPAVHVNIKLKEGANLRPEHLRLVDMLVRATLALKKYVELGKEDEFRAVVEELEKMLRELERKKGRR